MEIKTAQRQALKGNRKAMRFLYNEYKQEIKFMCRCLLKKDDVEKDVLKIFEITWRNPELISKSTRYIDYLRAETARYCKNLSEGAKAQPAEKATAQENDGGKLENRISDVESIPEDIKKAVTDTLFELQDSQRFAVLPYYLADMQPKAIAGMLKITEEKAVTALNYGTDNMRRGIIKSTGGISKKDMVVLSTAMPQLIKDAAARESVSRETDSAAAELIKKYGKSSGYMAYWAVAAAVVICVAVGGAIWGVSTLDAQSAAEGSESSAAESTDSEPSAEDTAEESTAGESETSVSSEATETGLHHAEIEVEGYGTISVELDADTAPISVTNFMKLANEGFYDGLTFHRIIDGFMIQGGDPNGDGTGGSDTNIKGEFSANGIENNISHERGVISMARSSLGNDTASSQFFIMQADNASLDGQYAAFGHVTDGMDIVDKICADTPTTDDNGTVEAANQPVITSVKIID